MVLSFPDDQKILMGPNVWIADSVATVHMNPHLNGAMVFRDGISSEDITMGNGSKEKVSKVVKIPGRVCDKNGKVQMEGTLNEVMICPDAEFNLFSITRMTQSGWELSGNKDALVLKKNGMEIKFDIVIPTGK